MKANRNEYMRKWYAANKDKVKAWAKRYRDQNPEGSRARSKRYREEHREELQRKKLEYCRNNRDRECERAKRWHEANRERANATCRRNYREDSERYKERAQQRRALVANLATEAISSAAIYERDRWRCGLCGKRVNAKLKHPHPMSASLDHIIPISRGGAHTQENLQCAHLRCNLQKSTAERGQLNLPILAFDAQS